MYQFNIEKIPMK